MLGLLCPLAGMYVPRPCVPVTLCQPNMLLGHQLLIVPAVLASTQSIPENELTQCSALANELSATNTPDAGLSLCLFARASAFEAQDAKKRQGIAQLHADSATPSPPPP